MLKKRNIKYKKIVIFVLLGLFFLNIIPVSATDFSQTINASLFKIEEEEYFLKITKDFQELYKVTYLNAGNAVKNKFNNKSNSAIKDFIKYDLVKVQSVIDKLQSKLDAKGYSAEYKNVSRKSLIAAYYYSLALSSLIEYIDDTVDLKAADDLQIFSFNLIKGLENISVVDRYLKGGV